jgi:DNA-binding transcriptional ArsR family regulator
VLWHLRKLTEAGLVRSSRICNRTVYYPTEMLEEPDVQLLGLLSEEKNAAAVRLVQERPGISQAEAISLSGCPGRSLNVLAEAGILGIVRDGRHRRYYPGEALRRRKEALEKKGRRFRQHLLSRLEQDGLAPEAVGPGREHLEIRVKLGTESATLKFCRNPYLLLRQ